MTEITDAERNKLKDFLDQDNFYIKLRKNDPEITNFFFNNFDLLINFIFEDQTADYARVNKCISFLITPDLKIHNKILQETKLIDFLINYPQKFRQIDHSLRLRYRDLIEAFLLPEPYKFNKNVGNSKFFTNLISVCDYNTSFEMLQKVISDEDQKVIYHLLAIHFIDSISQFITGDQIINFNSQRILIQLIDRGCENFVAEVLTNNALISSFVNYTIEHPKAWKNFSFIENIYKYSINYSKSSDWKSIEVTISSCTDDFRKIIMKTDKWSDTPNICISILVEILSFHNMLNEKDIKLFHFLFEKFFSMPKCSILHLSVLKYFTLFHKLNGLNLKILNESHIITKIIDCYKNREQLFLCNYFGQLREMSVLISPLIDKNNIDEWNSIVVKKNKEIYKLINNNVNNKLPFKCNNRNIFSLQNKKIVFILISVFAVILVLAVFILIKRRKLSTIEDINDNDAEL